jgi:hypothetical protein
MCQCGGGRDYACTCESDALEWASEQVYIKVMDGGYDDYIASDLEIEVDALTDVEREDYFFKNDKSLSADFLKDAREEAGDAAADKYEQSEYRSI